MNRGWLWGIIVVPIFVSFGCERGDTQEAVYSDLHAAKNAHAIGAGKWIPLFIPGSATSIRDMHNLDTNEGWVFFKFDPKDAPLLRTACAKESVEKLVQPRRSPGVWWPPNLVEGKSGEDRDGRKFELYQCEGRTGLAIDTAKGEAYYWVASR